MTFLANENFPFPSIKFLRQAGYTISPVCELYPGISDKEVIDKARFVAMNFKPPPCPLAEGDNALYPPLEGEKGGGKKRGCM